MLKSGLKMFSVKGHFIGLWIPLIYLIQHAGGAWLRCYKGSIDDYVITPLEQPLPESFTSCLNPTLPTIIYTFGYRGRCSGPATTAVLTAYIWKKKRNVILLDWEEEARSGLLGIPLGYALSAVPKAKKIGKELGEALMRLKEVGVNMTDMHLMGHSLGAHIMGYAGRRTREDGYVVERITGLDPARALYEGTLAVQTGLERTCAKFVDIVHSDPGGYGTSSSTGTVDIWPNYVSSSEGTLQPGCPAGNFDMFSPEDEVSPESYGPIRAKVNNLRLPFKRPNLCSHDRSWHYLVEAIASPTAFPAVSAVDVDDWLSTGGRKNQTIYLGDLTSNRARGNFYLTTNSKPSYGKGVDGLKPNPVLLSHRKNSTLTKILTYLR